MDYAAANQGKYINVDVLRFLELQYRQPAPDFEPGIGYVQRFRFWFAEADT